MKEQMMQSIAFFNNKGGVGKTTLLCNVAAYLALEMKKKVLIIDADPQCNATQLLLNDDEIMRLYDGAKDFTIYSVIHPLSLGKGYAEEIKPLKVDDYGVDLIAGDPRLALKEDLLSQDWQDAIGGRVRGLRTTLLFRQLLSQCGEYDYVLFDMGPSLGSINRAVLLACDFFVSPMSIDIFSLKAIENIAAAIGEWKKKLLLGFENLEDDDDSLTKFGGFKIKFIGYVAQQYMQKTTNKEKRAVDAYEKILKEIPKTINKYLIDGLNQDRKGVNYRIGLIPNLFSLVPMSQTAHKPVFLLKAKDGVRGAHFNKVKDAEEIFEKICKNLIKNINGQANDN